MKGQRHSPVSNEGSDISVNGRYLNIYCALAVSQGTDGSVFGEGSGGLKNPLHWAVLWEREQGLATSRNFQRLPAAEAVDGFQISSWQMLWNYIYPSLVARFLYYFQGVSVNGITGVNLLLFESNTGYTGQFFGHCHPGTLWPFKWTVRKSRFILPNGRHLTLDNPVRSWVSLTCAHSREERQT